MPFPYLPKPIYEVLPLVYVAGGLSSAIWSTDKLGVISGLALAVAGLHITAQRKHYRHQQTQAGAKLSRSQLERLG